MRVQGLDFDTPEFLEWRPEDPVDCEVWATASVGDDLDEGTALFQIHICTPASIKRIENRSHCFLIREYAGKAELIARLNAFIIEKTRWHRGDPFHLLARFWRYEYGSYDKRGHLIG